MSAVDRFADPGVRVAIVSTGIEIRGSCQGSPSVISSNLTTHPLPKLHDTLALVNVFIFSITQ